MASKWEDQKSVATVDNKSVLIPLRAWRRLQIFMRKTFMVEDPILRDAAEFRKRLEAGDEKFLNAEESARWRESFRRRQEDLRKQLEARLKP